MSEPAYSVKLNESLIKTVFDVGMWLCSALRWLPLPEKSLGECQPAMECLKLSDLTLNEATDNIYTAIKNDNEDLDIHIAALKTVMKREGIKEAVFEPGKLAQSNRQGRKIMQSYFKKKGVIVSFSA